MSGASAGQRADASPRYAAAMTAGRAARRRPAVPRGERHGNHQGARGQVLAGGEHRAHQGVRPHHHVGGPRDQRKQQKPGLHLIGEVPELPDLAPVQHATCRAREHGAVTELGAHLGRPAAQPPEWAVLGVAQRRHRAGQTPPGLLAVAEDGQLLGDLQDRQRCPLVVLEHQAAVAGALAGTTSAGTSSVTGTGQGVPSARVPRSATAARSSAVRKPRSGANAPEVSSSSSASCASPGVHACAVRQFTGKSRQRFFRAHVCLTPARSSRNVRRSAGH